VGVVCEDFFLLEEVTVSGCNSVSIGIGW
jgi:hypothetical protein